MEKLVKKEMDGFLQRLKTLRKSSDQLEYSYSFMDQTLILYELRRPQQEGPNHKLAVARMKYISSRDIWKIYIRHHHLDWDVYKPQAEAKNLGQALKIIEEDKYSLFFGV